MDRDRRLCDLMQICWHEWEWTFDPETMETTSYAHCPKCGDVVLITHYHLTGFPKNPDFSLPEWRARLMDWAVEQEWWQTFLPWAMRKWFTEFDEDRTDCNYVKYLWRNLADLIMEYHGEEGK